MKAGGSLHFRFFTGPSGSQDSEDDILDDFDHATEVALQISIGNECLAFILWVGSAAGGQVKEVRVLVRANVIAISNGSIRRLRWSRSSDMLCTVARSPSAWRASWSAVTMGVSCKGATCRNCCQLCSPVWSRSPAFHSRILLRK